MDFNYPPSLFEHVTRMMRMVDKNTSELVELPVRYYPSLTAEGGQACPVAKTLTIVRSKHAAKQMEAPVERERILEDEVITQTPVVSHTEIPMQAAAKLQPPQRHSEQTFPNEKQTRNSLGRNMRAVPTSQESHATNENDNELFEKMCISHRQHLQSEELRNAARNLINEAFLEEARSCKCKHVTEQAKVEDMLNRAFPLSRPSSQLSNRSAHNHGYDDDQSVKTEPARGHHGRRRGASALEQLLNNKRLDRPSLCKDAWSSEQVTPRSENELLIDALKQELLALKSQDS